MRIIIGLGNPTKEYQATRHNIGWDAITRISDDYRIPLSQKKHKANCGFGYIEGEKVILAQPLTYMNLSGECVRELVDFYKVEPQDIIVIYDDINLDVGQLRIRKKGSDGGHNGIKSIISHLGTEDFPRIRVGIGEKPRNWDLADYVLSRFKADEEPVIRQALKDVSDACRIIITDSMDAAMNIYNKKKSGNGQANGPKDESKTGKAGSNQDSQKDSQNNNRKDKRKVKEGPKANENADTGDNTLASLIGRLFRRNDSGGQSK